LASGELVVMVNEMGSVKVLDTEALALSVTLIVKLEVTAFDGVRPVKAPVVGFSASHDGKPVADQV